MKKAAHGTTAKHAGSKKHVAAKKHNPALSAKARAVALAKAKAKAAHAGHAATVAKHAKHTKAAPAKWSPGWDVACCSAEAVAASLRLAGRPVSDQDVLDLYWLTADDPDAGATLEDTLRAALEYGIAGVRPLEFAPTLELGHGTVFAVDLLERHALTLECQGLPTLEGQAVWSWGERWPLTRPLETDEAWVITWP